jgi:endothelin-converting enzyme
MRLRILARTFSTLPVRRQLFYLLIHTAYRPPLDGGWIAAHPLPADKGSFGQFEALSQDNKRVIQHFLETPSATSSFTTSHDEVLLQKLRGFYSSCLKENRLDELGTEPLIHFVKTVQRLFRGTGPEITAEKDEKSGLTVKGLTAALAFLHSRGKSYGSSSCSQLID